MEYRQLWAVAAAVFCVLGMVAGCGSPPPKNMAPEENPVAEVATNDRATRTLGASRVILEGVGRAADDKHVGFVVKKVNVAQSDDDVETAIYMAYDKHFQKPIGFFLDDGATYRLDFHDERKLLGNFDLQRSLERLYELEGRFRLDPVE